MTGAGITGAIARAMTSRGCLRHRAVLLESLEGREADGEVAAALDHLQRCVACEREIGELSLVITGLRRLGATARRVEPRPGGWTRLVARLHRPSPRRRVHLAPLAGMLAVPLALAVVLAPRLETAPAGDGSTSAASASVGLPLAVHVGLAIDSAGSADVAGAAAPPSTPGIMPVPASRTDVLIADSLDTLAPDPGPASASQDDITPALPPAAAGWGDAVLAPLIAPTRPLPPIVE